MHGSSGAVHRIWVTINDRSPAMLRGLKIEMFWDGASTPAVSAPFGDFFGHGLSHMAAFQSALFASPEGKSFVCYIPMPFKTGMKIVITNESGKNLDLFSSLSASGIPPMELAVEYNFASPKSRILASP